MGVVVLRTAFTELLGVEHPIALAPMGGSAGGALAGAVSNGGGLGLVGGGRGDWAWLDRELTIVTEVTDRPWGVGFLSWSADVSVVGRALEHGPHAVMLSFGDPGLLAEPVLEAGVPLIVQVTDLDEAVRALEVGAQVLVRNAFLDRWRGREAELDADADARADYRRAAAEGDLSVVPVWAGEAVDLIRGLTSAGDLVAVIAAEAEAALLQAAPNPG